MPSTTEKASDNHAVPAAVLLLGLPRSGTTWLAKIFDSHPDTLYRHEPDGYGRLDHLPWAPAPESWPQHADAVRNFGEHLAGLRHAKIAGTLPQFRKNYLNFIQRAWNRTAIGAVKIAGRAGLKLPVPLWLPNAAVNRALLVTKSIESLARAGLLASAQPKAKHVIILRHPCGYTNSVLRGQTGHQFEGNGLVGDMGLLKLLTEAGCASDYDQSFYDLRELPPLERLIWQWLLICDKALRDCEGLANVRVVTYEQICADPQEEIRKLFEWVGLSLDQQTREFIGASTSTHRERYYSVYKKPAIAANAWREQLPDAIQQRVIRIACQSLAWSRYYSLTARSL